MICCPFTFTAARPTMGALNYLPLNSILPHRSYSLYRPAGVWNRVNNKASNKLREARWGSKPRTPVELNKFLHLLFPILLCMHLYVFLFADFIFAKARRIRSTPNRDMRSVRCGLLITYRRASKQFCLNMGLLLIVEMSGEILRWRREERTSAKLMAMRTNNFAAVCVCCSHIFQHTECSSKLTSCQECAVIAPLPILSIIPYLSGLRCGAVIGDQFEIPTWLLLIQDISPYCFWNH